MTRRALITGITGQDGSYLAELLLDEGLRGHRHGAAQQHGELRADRPHPGPASSSSPGDLLDEVSLIDVLREHRPHEVYNLAAQSFVQTSFGQPVLTGEITALGVTRLLDAIRIVDPDIRFYQASSSEMFGKVRRGAADARRTPFYPRSPVRRGQGLRPLDHGQLPRELRPARRRRASCSTTSRPAAASSS